MTEYTGETVDITPSWSGLLPGLILLITDGETPEARKAGADELRRMARLADAYVASAKGEGALGLPFTVVGEVVQSLGTVIVDRERPNITKEDVIGYLTSEKFEETELWDTLGKIVDGLELETLAWKLER
jgi:hypothetical protein